MTTHRHHHCTPSEENQCYTELEFFSEPRLTIELDNDHQNAAQKHDNATNKLDLIEFAINHHLLRLKVHVFPRTKLNVIGRTSYSTH
jgi:hypothetical protein